MAHNTTIRQSTSIKVLNITFCSRFLRYLRSLVPVGFREELVTLAAIALPAVSVFQFWGRFRLVLLAFGLNFKK